MTGSPRLSLIAALALPLLACAYVWGSTYRLAQQGEEWLIPINGYDPRDLLRGHYVQYQYDWPVRMVRYTGGTEPEFDPSYVEHICIEGKAPDISGVRSLSAAQVSDDNRAKGCATVVRASIGARREIHGLSTGIFYASQDRALALSEKLRDEKLQGLLRVRIRPDGVIQPLEIEFRPKSPNRKPL